MSRPTHRIKRDELGTAGALGERCEVGMGGLAGVAGADDAEIAFGELVYSEGAAVGSDADGGLVEAAAVLSGLFSGSIAGIGSGLRAELNSDRSALIDAVAGCVGLHGRNVTPVF